MKTKKSQFITKTSVKALINSPRIMRQAGLSSEEMAKAEISRKTTELADYVISGVILECYKPLFAGHFNGYRDGFIKQPAAWYAKIRKSVAGMIENKARFDGIAESGAEPENDMTALNVMKVWEYLALHDNGKGKTKTVNVIDMLSHVAPSYLQKGEYIRTEFIGSLFNALIALAKLTHEYRDELDFEITSLEVDQFDRAYAVNHGYREGTALFMVEALKHHLKAHNNTLILQVSRNGGPGHGRE